MADNETTADIIAWLRMPREGENAYLTLWRDEIADRLEAAHKRERGDCAKLREAIENSNGLLEELAAIGEWGESAREQIAENNAALAAPATAEKSSAVGDAAKLREALVRFYEWAILDLNENAWIGDSSGNYKKLLDAMAKEIAAALAAPPRNCDRFANFETAQKAYLRETKTLVVDDEMFDWLFSPATEKKGEVDGRK